MVLAAMHTTSSLASQINSPLDFPITIVVDRHTHCRSGLVLKLKNSKTER